MKPQEKLKILVIDDSEFDRRMIVSAMQSICNNLTCVELSGGMSAVKTMCQEKPSLTILDIRMPGISGWDVLEDIQSEEALRDSKVVIMSGTGSQFDIKKASLNGADGFYTKPNTRSDYGIVALDLKAAFLDVAA
jgi:two-component system chemotaxis response regulator CheY